jgi:hypothetical protein
MTNRECECQEVSPADATECRVVIGLAIAGLLGYDINKRYERYRAESLGIAHELGADLGALHNIARAKMLYRGTTITLPRGRYGHPPHGRYWCRRNDGTLFEDHVVGPGEYTVGSTDGFRRRDNKRWTVAHIQVGQQVWTVAN